MAVKPDEIWKVAIHSLLPSFVDFFYPQYYHQIDWTKEVHFLDKELHTIQPNSRPKNRIADMLVMLHRKYGKPLCIFLHFEIQGYFERLFPYRIHQIRYRIEDMFGVNPSILCIYTDDNPNFHPKEYYKKTWGTSTQTIFDTYKVMDNPPSLYKKPDSIASLIMETVYQSTQLKGKPDSEIMNLFVPLVRKLFLKGYSKKEIEIALSFIETHVKFGNSDNYRIFEQNIDEMVKFKTSDELVADFFDTEKNIRLFKIKEKKWEAKTEKLEAETEYERQEKERERQEKERERQEKERSVLFMLNQGINIELVARVLGVPIEEITRIQDKYKDNNPILDILKG